MRRGEWGFTLIELMVALAVLGLLLSLLGGAMRIGLGWMEEGRVRTQGLQRVAGAQALLRRALANIEPLTRAAGGERPTILFEGTRHRLAFAGRLSEHAAIPGSAWLTLALEGGGGPGALMLGWQSLDQPQAGVSRESISGGLMVLPDVTAVEIRYLGSADGRSPAVWTDEWSGMTRLPLAIRIELGAPADAYWSWPPLVVRPMLD